MDKTPTQNWIHKAALIIGLGVFAAGAWAQTGAIEGDVKGEDGKGVKDALVKIERTDIKGNYKVKSDKKGHYFHAGLPLGTYTVSVEIDGKPADEPVKNVRTRLGDPVSINFDLGQAKAKQQAMQKAAETGELSKEQVRELTPEQRAKLEKEMKERSAQLQKNKALNDAYNAGREAMQQATNIKGQMAGADPAKKEELKKQEAALLQTAVAKFDEGTKLDANQSVIWGNMAEAYGLLYEVTSGTEQQDAANKAIEAYGKAIALKPDDAAFHNNYGLLLAKVKKTDEAQAELTKAAQLEPANAGKYYYNLGAVLVNTGQYEPAVLAFKKAIDTDPNHADAQYWYATALSSRITMGADGKVVAPEGMKEALDKYLALKPDGQFAQAAKDLLATISSSIETKYVSPNAKKDEKKTTKKK